MKRQINEMPKTSKKTFKIKTNLKAGGADGTVYNATLGDLIEDGKPPG